MRNPSGVCRCIRHRGILALCVVGVACTEGSAERRRELVGGGSGGSDVGGVAIEPPAPVPPVLSLTPGARYFERDGIQAPMLLRNVSAPSVDAFRPLLRDTSAAGTTLVRLQLTQGFGYDTLGITKDGAVLPAWASSWDAVLAEADQDGLGVIVVFTLWGDWNDGTPALGWTHFAANPLSQGRGGPAASPAELFADTETQRLWLGWLSTLVTRWSSRSNVIAWELFSELDLASGANVENATAFIEKAHALVRAIDPWRPVFASTSDLPLLDERPWQALWNSDGNDIASVHPYDPDLDRIAVERTRSVLALSPKPVLIGESGLDAAPPDGTTLTSAPRAAEGLRHAIWAELGSGAASARALYWEDGYAAYYPGSGLPLVTASNSLEAEPARWLAGKDFQGLVPALVSSDSPLFCTALASTTHVLGWARNGRLAPPDWNATPLERARIQISLPDTSADATWDIALTQPDDGSKVQLSGNSQDHQLSFEVTGPLTSIAFEATSKSPTPNALTR